MACGATSGWPASPPHSSSGFVTEWQQEAVGRGLGAPMGDPAGSITIAGRYLPMGDMPGGDWYDVVALGGGQIAVVMGDVVGRGPQAAAVMAELREALRSYARVPDSSPATVVGQLNHVALQTGVGEMTTLVYIIVSTRLCTASLTNAGHCPPLLLGTGGDARFLEGGRSYPLGVVGTDVQPEAAVPFSPGMTLVLYTDGLVESRTRSLGDGLRQLRRATANGPKEMDALCDHLLEVLRQGQVQQDDIALLTIRFDQQRRTAPGPDRVDGSAPASGN